MNTTIVSTISYAYDRLLRQHKKH